MTLIETIRKKPGTVNYFNDITAGFIVALVSIPISMGYAGIAGLPAVYGLYGSLFPILIFSFFTTSPQFVIGVDAMPAVMVGSVLVTLNIEGETSEAMELVPVITFLVMVWFFIFYLFKAGRIVKYISKPVMGGFISGVGLTIIIMQIPKLFGGTTGTGELLILLKHIYQQISLFNSLSFILGIGTVIIILVFKKLCPKIPMTVIMMFIGAWLQITFHLDEYGVKLLPDVENSSIRFAFPKLSLILTDVSLLTLESFSIAVVIMAQSLLATGNYALKYGDKVDNNRELLAYGMMNAASMLTGCLPVNGSVSRSGIADSYKARSQIMSVSAFVTMFFVILFGKSYLKYLPVPILTGIVMTALIGILEIRLCGRLFKTSRREWMIFMMSFMGVLLFGTVYGVLIGCALSFADVAIQATAPPTTFLGRISGQGNFYALDRNTAARPIKYAVIYRFSGNLIFANVDRFQEEIEQSIRPDTKCVIVDARSISNIDITAVDRLLAICDSLQKRGINFYLTEHSGHLNDLIRLLGGGKLVERGNVRRTITLALRDSGIFKPYELQDEISYSDSDDEKEEMLAEFEWAFGNEARQRLEKLANAAAKNIVENKDEADKDSLLENDRLETDWGKLGRFDESEFWDFLEFRLEEMASKGKISDEELVRLERRIEERRIRTEHKLEKINKGALKKLKKHRARIREYLKGINPEEYAHMKDLQRQYYEQLKEKNPELAKQLAVLHDFNDSSSD